MSKVFLMVFHKNSQIDLVFKIKLMDLPILG